MRVGEVLCFLGKSASVPSWPLCNSSLDAAYTQTALLLCDVFLFSPPFSPSLFLTGKNVKRNFWPHWRWDAFSLQEGQSKIIFPFALFPETTELFGPNKSLWENAIWQNCKKKKKKRGGLQWERSSDVNYNQSCNMVETWGVSLQIIASRRLCFSRLPTLGESGGGLLHMGSCCDLVVFCFNILLKISFSRGWHRVLITIT